jgi:hypothetical protein
MKILSYILIIIAVLLIIFNISFLDFSNLFEGESLIALSTIVAGLCVIILMLLLQASERFKNLDK